MTLRGNLFLSLPHLVAGAIGLASGGVALCALKGASLHRRSGLIFVYSMLLVAASGTVMALVKSQRLNLVGALLTFYMVTSALLTVRPRVPKFRWIDVAAMVIGLAVGLLSMTFGFEALNSASGKIDGLGPGPAFMFGGVLLVAAAGDLRMLLRGVEGRHRIARHLWRMCFALFSAASSFFLAQVPKLVPALRNSRLLMLPVLLVLLLMFYWLARVRFTRRFQGAGPFVPVEKPAGLS
jgi:hypothetical protein